MVRKTAKIIPHNTQQTGEAIGIESLAFGQRRRPLFYLRLSVKSVSVTKYSPSIWLAIEIAPTAAKTAFAVWFSVGEGAVLTATS